MYFLSPVVLHAGLLGAWCDFMLFNIEVKRKECFRGH